MERKPQPAYQYKHLELALANLFHVSMAELPAFRARLRHLRNLGVPTNEKPGSGKAITYSRDNAIQLLIALEAELLGLPPKFAAAFSRTAMRDLAKKADRAAKSGERLILSVEPKFGFDINDAAIFIGSSEPNVPLVDENAHRRMVINLATSISLLDRELTRATGAKGPFDDFTDRFRKHLPRARKGT